VPETVRRVGELDRDRRILARIVVPAPVRLDVTGDFLPDRERQELVDHDPLVVPPDQPPRLLEGVGDALIAQPVHRAVVEPQESQVKLGDEQVDVVARVADEGCALMVAREVVRAE
jgi:hypothetical protein